MRKHQVLLLLLIVVPFLHGPMPMQCPTPFSLLLCMSL